MIGLSYKQKCNNFGYLSIQMWLKGNDNVDFSVSSFDSDTDRNIDVDISKVSFDKVSTYLDDPVCVHHHCQDNAQLGRTSGVTVLPV